MEKDNYFLEKFSSHDGKNITIHHWPVEKPKLLIHLVHGMSEHGYRYHEFAKWLNQKEIYAYAPDLRGHGKTADSIENIGLFYYFILVLLLLFLVHSFLDTLDMKE